jgi:putative aldouronate transport system substrate-binding protein
MKIKKVTALFLAAAMAMSVMTGCGSNGGSASENDSKSSESKPAEESKEEKEESDAGAESAGGEEASGGSITFPLAETMEFTSFSGMNQSYTLPDTLAMQEAMSRANINITFDSVLSADLTEKRNLMLASGEYPDMLFKSGIGMGDLTKYGGREF